MCLAGVKIKVKRFSYFQRWLILRKYLDMMPQTAREQRISKTEKLLNEIEFLQELFS